MTYNQEITKAYNEITPFLVRWIMKRAKCNHMEAEDIAGATWLRIVEKGLPGHVRLVVSVALGMILNRHRKLKRQPVNVNVWGIDTMAYASEPEEPDEFPMELIPKEHRPVVSQLLEVARSPHPPTRLQDMAAAIGKSRFVFLRLREALAK